MNYKAKERLPAEAYVKGILEGNKVILSKAITLIESNLPQDEDLSLHVLEAILPFSGKSLRIGITGIPGVGKSTFIESLGNIFTAENKKLAVLAIDPSSQKTKGSIMGDKTRMETLAKNTLAYIRPTATGSKLGGVGDKSRETILLCEAAGYEVIIVETVGVGQSEVSVHGMVDFFLLLMIAGAGDELQGIKKGIMEIADAIVITKADGENINAAKIARSAYENAVHLYPPSESGWACKVMTCSAIENQGLKEVWILIKDYYKFTNENGFYEIKRNQQNIQWMHENIRVRLEGSFYKDLKVKDCLLDFEDQVRQGILSPTIAANKLWNMYKM
ncbi:MAG: methylmalonyl Co-A mutase-associated GTPase MeaB [Bacteroidota bacterium]|nr:methylmalonyl Co-A mutase-associated GTPase MeaB [Bacteroidota bacterium]